MFTLQPYIFLLFLQDNAISKDASSPHPRYLFPLLIIVKSWGFFKDICGGFFNSDHVTGVVLQVYPTRGCISITKELPIISFGWERTGFLNHF